MFSRKGPGPKKKEKTHGGGNGKVEKPPKPKDFAEGVGGSRGRMKKRKSFARQSLRTRGGGILRKRNEGPLPGVHVKKRR